MPSPRSGHSKFPSLHWSRRIRLASAWRRHRLSVGPIEQRVYQAIRSAGRTVLQWLGAGLLIAGPGSCNAAPASERAPAVSAPLAPLARVTYSSRRGRSLDLGDRVTLFDRIAFSSPSAIIHDPARDVYWVSNANAGATDRAGRGFISRLDPEGALSTLNFIDTRGTDVVLNSPRGLAVAGDTLYVADISAIRKFKADDGAALGSIEIPGARFLSDVAAGADGTLYAVDVGGDPNMEEAAEERVDAVYQIAATGEVTTVARRPDLGGPFALIADGTGLWITCTSSADLVLLVPGTGDGNAPDAGRLDLPNTPQGLAAMPDGTLLISSSSEGVVYRGFRDGPFAPIVGDLESPADLGYDAIRKRLLIPLFSGHALAIFELLPLPSGSKSPPSGAESAP
jgi:hypothetical protein